MKRSLSAVVGLLILGAFAWIAVTPAQRANNDDYMSAELRGEVEALKKDLRSGPTNPENFEPRMRTLWKWINAYSLTGGPVPVNATSTIGACVLAVTEWKRGGDPPSKNLQRQIDLYGAEFTLKDEEPNALGKVTLNVDKPLPTESWQQIEQTYTVGERLIEQGGVIMVARQLQSDSGPIQTDNPGGDNYLSARTSNPNVTLAKTKTPLSGMHGGFRGAVPLPSFTLEKGNLNRGETITIVYGDKSGGSEGYKQQSFESKQVMLPIYVDLDGSGNFLTPAWPGYELVGGAATGVSVIVPSVLEPGEEFDISIRWEDKIYNRATNGIPAATVSIDGQSFRDLPADGPALQTLSGAKADREGVLRVEVKSADGKISALSNPLWVRDNPPFRVYWGETHTHTAMAEGQGTIDASYTYGRDDARLDFMGISEHDTWIDDGEWRNMQQAVDRYTVQGKFIALLGYEWTVARAYGGHHNIFFRSNKSQRVGKQLAPTLSSLYEGLRERYNTRDVLSIPHAHQAGDWRQSDPDIENFIEIMSMHGTFEWFGNYYLRNGHQVGFVAASDDHRSKPGYSSVSGTSSSTPLQQFGGLAAVMAPEKTTDAIFDAMKDTKVYAVTSAQRILIDMAMNGEGMGERLPYTEDRRIRARVMGTAPITEVSVVKNGETVYVKRPSIGSLARQSRLVVGFESSSEPFFRDNPRPYRTWKGTIVLKKATLAGLNMLNFDNRHKEFATADGATVKFLTRTRGRADTLMLELDNATPSSEITINLDEADECCKAPIPIRKEMTIPASKVQVKLGDLRDGHLVKQTPFGRDPDTITFQLVGDKQPLDYDIEFVDTGEMNHGDYYYVRVEQLNGARAWSSPIWVGGEEPR